MAIICQSVSTEVSVTKRLRVNVHCRSCRHWVAHPAGVVMSGYWFLYCPKQMLFLCEEAGISEKHDRGSGALLLSVAESVGLVGFTT